MNTRYRPEWPYCSRCDYDVATRTELDGGIVCQFCRGHEHVLGPKTTTCPACIAAADERWAERMARAMAHVIDIRTRKRCENT